MIEEKRHLLQEGLKVGIPYRKVEVKIIQIDKDAISCHENELLQLILPVKGIGEIIVSGPHALTEYFNIETALKQNKIFIGKTCWHSTGDSGYLDKYGVVYLTGKCSTLIYSDKKLIAPFIYENYFQSIQGVEMRIVEYNKIPLAIIELKKGMGKETVLAQIRDTTLSSESIKFVSKIPRDPRHSSKIDYEKLSRE